MENILDYSTYVNAAYIVAGIIFGILMIYAVTKFYCLKNDKKI